MSQRLLIAFGFREGSGRLDACRYLQQKHGGNIYPLREINTEMMRPNISHRFPDNICVPPLQVHYEQSRTEYRNIFVPDLITPDDAQSLREFDFNIVNVSAIHPNSDPVITMNANLWDFTIFNEGDVKNFGLCIDCVVDCIISKRVKTISVEP